MNRHFLKVASIVSTLTLTASLLAACTPAGNTTTAGGTTTAAEIKAPTGGLVRYNLGADPKTLDPALNTAVDGGTVLQNLYVGLMRTDENDDGGWRVHFIWSSRSGPSPEGAASRAASAISAKSPASVKSL